MVFIPVYRRPIATYEFHPTFRPVTRSVGHVSLYIGINLGASVIVFGWFKKKITREQLPPSRDVYAGLRGQVLSLAPNDIGVSQSDEIPTVWGVLMEFARPNAVVMLVSLADNTTSLYFSNGGGVIGAGEHQTVAAATQSYIALAQQYATHFHPTTDYPLPDVGSVRFYLLTFSGVKTVEADEQELGNQGHLLSPLFHKGHEVITNVRVTTQKQ